MEKNIGGAFAPLASPCFEYLLLLNQQETIPGF